MNKLKIIAQFVDTNKYVFSNDETKKAVEYLDSKNEVVSLVTSLLEDPAIVSGYNNPATEDFDTSKSTLVKNLKRLVKKDSGIDKKKINWDEIADTFIIETYNVYETLLGAGYPPDAFISNPDPEVVQNVLNDQPLQENQDAPKSIETKEDVENLEQSVPPETQVQPETERSKSTTEWGWGGPEEAQVYEESLPSEPKHVNNETESVAAYFQFDQKHQKAINKIIDSTPGGGISREKQLLDYLWKSTTKSLEKLPEPANSLANAALDRVDWDSILASYLEEKTGPQFWDREHQVDEALKSFDEAIKDISQ